jgi:AcrR family transcriptional regulator
LPKTTPAAPRPRSRRGEGDRLREEILAAAEGLLMETASEDAVSIRAVANAVGVTPPSIYRHFADKDMLLLEVCRHSFTEFTGAMEEALADGADAEEQMAALARAYLRYARDFPEHYRLMFMARFELSAQAYAEEMVSDGSSFELLLRIAQQMIDAGRVRPGIAERGPVHVGVLFWAPVHALATLHVAKPGMLWGDVAALEDDLIASTIRGITVPDEPRPG